MKRIVYLFSLLIFVALLLGGCDNDDDVSPSPTANNNGGSNPTDTANTDTTITKTKTQMLAKKWIVDEAYVNGSTPDNSSKGLTLDVRADGSYTLSTGYVGTWVFESNETKINWDKGTQFNQVFTLQEFTETKIDATFISAFTGENARWLMVPH